MARPYRTSALTLVASLLAMFVISLEQIRSMDDFYLNASNLFISMTGVGAMGLIMFVAMRSMFKDAGKNRLAWLRCWSCSSAASAWRERRPSSATRAFSTR